MPTQRIVRQQPHHCIIPVPSKYLQVLDEVDDVIECCDCGRRWVLRKWLIGYGWVPLRWYHLRARRLARRIAGEAS